MQNSIEDSDFRLIDKLDEPEPHKMGIINYVFQNNEAVYHQNEIIKTENAEV